MLVLVFDFVVTCGLCVDVLDTFEESRNLRDLCPLVLLVLALGDSYIMAQHLLTLIELDPMLHRDQKQ